MNPPPDLNTPSWLQQLQWTWNPFNYMDRAAAQYPDIFRTGVFGFGKPMVFIQHPQAIQDMFTRDGKEFTVVGNPILEPLFGKQSIIMLEGQRHQRMRNLLMPPFHGSSVQAYSQLITTLTAQQWSKIPLGKPFWAYPILLDISLQVLLEAVFGLVPGDRCEQLKIALTKMSDLSRVPFGFLLIFFPALRTGLGKFAWEQFLHLRDQIDTLIYGVIQDRRLELKSQNHGNYNNFNNANNNTSNDILSLLIAAQDEAGNPLTDEELRDELITFMMAGHETTVSAMTWALYWIHYLPEVKAKLMAELRGLGLNFRPTDLFQLPYLNGVCNETLRIYPVGFISTARIVTEPVSILGYDLEPETFVVASIYLTHQRPELYPQPQQFRPERFLERKFMPFDFMPFGGGARRCIGGLWRSPR